MSLRPVLTPAPRRPRGRGRVASGWRSSTRVRCAETIRAPWDGVAASRGATRPGCVIELTGRLAQVWLARDARGALAWLRDRGLIGPRRSSGQPQRGRPHRGRPRGARRLRGRPPRGRPRRWGRSLRGRPPRGRPQRGRPRGANLGGADPRPQRGRPLRGRPRLGAIQRRPALSRVDAAGWTARAGGVPVTAPACTPLPAPRVRRLPCAGHAAAPSPARACHPHAHGRRGLRARVGRAPPDDAASAALGTRCEPSCAPSRPALWSSCASPVPAGRCGSRWPRMLCCARRIRCAWRVGVAL